MVEDSQVIRSEVHMPLGRADWLRIQVKFILSTCKQYENSCPEYQERSIEVQMTLYVEVAFAHLIVYGG